MNGPPASDARWSRVATDICCIASIALAAVIVRRPFLQYELLFDNTSALFHYGHRVLVGGHITFHGGPLPVYVDAASQWLLGSKYLASLDVGLAVAILRGAILWLIVRRFAGRIAASALAIYYTLDPAVSPATHALAADADLFALLAIWLAVLATERNARMNLALAGVAGGLLWGITPGGGIACALLLAAATLGGALRGRALWAGYAFGVAVAVACAVAIGASASQMFGHASAIAGGGIALPVVIAVGALWLLAAPDRELSPGTLALLVVPAAVNAGLMLRVLSCDAYVGLPRALLAAAWAVAAIAPSAAKRWFGMEPMLLSAIASFTLATGEYSLIGGALLIAFASTRLAGPVKVALACALASTSLIHVEHVWRAGIDPFVAKDSTVALGDEAPHPHGARQPLFRSLRMTKQRSDLVDAIADAVPVGSSCFVDADAPALYDAIDCTNPTPTDSVDALTEWEASTTSAALLTRPPEFIVARPRLLFYTADPADAVQATIAKLLESYEPILDLDAVAELPSLTLYRRTHR